MEFNRATKPTLEGSAWTGRFNLSSLSLFSFSELNKALNTNAYNWCIQLMRLLLGLKHVLGTNLIPLRTKLVTQTKRVPAWPVINQLCFSERHFSAKGISLRPSEVQMKLYERSLQALLSSAPLSFAARSSVIARLASLAQIGELARRLWDS